ncbi:hypothetical protein SYJ56_13855 [Algoriphagus sp. D3-2-R+10]|nr:hypothetical protein [Algoriphagus sp. D3-2-R+10]
MSGEGGSQAAVPIVIGMRGEALLASWPFACLSGRQGSFGPSQKNIEIENEGSDTQRDVYPPGEIPSYH